MKKIVFIVPYYGKFPNYFREWVYTAGFLEKQNIDFLLITDIKISFKLPNNIHIKKMSFDEFKEKVQKKFNFKIALETPYKLCDFKCTLGYIFYEDIKEYDFWGNCDIDQIWGNVRKFITEDILNKYDRIQYLGHFILYRNCKKMNEAFMLPGAIYNYKKVLSSPVHFSFCEHSGMMKIIEKNKISNYIETNYADISPKYSRTIISRVKNYKYQILYWEDGNIYRYYIDDDKNIRCDEFMYFHFQRKHPKSLNWEKDNYIPKRILYKCSEFQELNVEKITSQYIKNHCDYISDKIDKSEKKKYILEKIKKFLEISFFQKKLWIKQRIATRFVLNDKEYFKLECVKNELQNKK